MCADLIRDIKDPEHPHTLEELGVVKEESITVQYKTSTNDVDSSIPSSSSNTHHTQQGMYM